MQCIFNIWYESRHRLAMRVLCYKAQLFSSRLEVCKISLHFWSSMPSLPTVRSSRPTTYDHLLPRAFTGVMMELKRSLRSEMKSRSRLVTSPRSFAPMRPLSVTGKPVKPSFSFKESNSAKLMVGGTQTSSKKRLTSFHIFLPHTEAFST